MIEESDYFDKRMYHQQNIILRHITDPKSSFAHLDADTQRSIAELPRKEFLEVVEALGYWEKISPNNQNFLRRTVSKSLEIASAIKTQRLSSLENLDNISKSRAENLMLIMKAWNIIAKGQDENSSFGVALRRNPNWVSFFYQLYLGLPPYSLIDKSCILNTQYFYKSFYNTRYSIPHNLKNPHLHEATGHHLSRTILFSKFLRSGQDWKGLDRRNDLINTFLEINKFKFKDGSDTTSLLALKAIRFLPQLEDSFNYSDFNSQINTQKYFSELEERGRIPYGIQLLIESDSMGISRKKLSSRLSVITGYKSETIYSFLLILSKILENSLLHYQSSSYYFSTKLIHIDKQQEITEILQEIKKRMYES